jgi:hypothetical protein
MTPLEAIPILPTQLGAPCLTTSRLDRVSAVTNEFVMGRTVLTLRRNNVERAVEPSAASTEQKTLRH